MSKAAGKFKGRIFAIGDVHGCADELKRLLDLIQPTAEDRVIFLGDYVDRGPDSRGVIDQVLALSQKCEVIALKGNHESLFLDFLERPESAGSGLFVLNGGTATLANYTLANGEIEIPEEHVRFLKTLRYFYETDDAFFVHAGVPDLPLSKINVEDHGLEMLWLRSPFLNSGYQWEKLIVHGHTPVREVEEYFNRINLDTACVYDGFLTAMEFPSRQIHQVEKGLKGEPVLYAPEAASARVSTRFTGRLPVTCGRVDEPTFTFETLNYNPFGFLMRADPNAAQQPDFEADDQITGHVGLDPNMSLQFKGQIVRRDSRGPFTVWGVRIDQLLSDERKIELAAKPAAAPAKLKWKPNVFKK